MNFTKDLLPAEDYVVATGIPQGCPDDAVERHFDKQWHGGCGDVVRVVRPYGGTDPAVALVMFKNDKTVDKVATFGDHTIEGAKIKVEKLSEPFTKFSATLNKKKVQWGVSVEDYLRDKLGLKVEESPDGLVVIKGLYWQVSEAKKYLTNPDPKGAGVDANTPVASPRRKKTNATLANKIAQSAELKQGAADNAPGVRVEKPRNATKSEEHDTGRPRGASGGDESEEFHDTLEDLGEQKNGTGQDQGGPGKLQRQRSSDSKGSSSKKSDNLSGKNSGTSRDARGAGGDGGVVQRSPAPGSGGGRNSSGRPQSLHPSFGASGESLDVHRGGAAGTRRSYARDDASFSPHSPMDVDDNQYQSLQVNPRTGAALYDQPRVQDAVNLRGKGNAVVLIYKTDITKLSVDAIVNPVGLSLDSGGGVATAIRKAAGFKYSNAIRDEKWRLPTLRHALVVNTNGFDLGCRLVFHIRSPDGLNDYGIHRGPRDVKKQLEDAVLAILKEADRGGDIKSVAIPAIGAGQASMSAREAAPILVKTACEFPATSLQEIHLVDFNDATVSALKFQAGNILRAGGRAS